MTERTSMRDNARTRLGLLTYRSAMRLYAALGDPAAALLTRGPDDNPYRYYEHIRARGELSASRLGMHQTASHAVVNSILRDQRFGVRTADGRGWDTMQPGSMGRRGLVHPSEDSFLSQDPPKHTRLRRLVAPWFTPRAVRERTERIEQVVDGFLDELAGRDSFDLIDDFAMRIPIQVICDLLGVPSAEYRRFIPWSAVVAASLDDVRSLSQRNQLWATLREMEAYFTELIEARRREPGNDLVSELVATGDKDQELLRADLLATVEILLIAGFETAVNLIGNGVLALLRHPEVRDWMLAQPDRCADVLEEVLRYDPPVHFTVRIAHEPVDLGTTRLPKDSAVMLFLAGANRDPAIFTDPDRFDPTRQNNREHLAFSAGVHYCVGAGLGRIEATVALRALFTRYPQLSQAGRVQRRPSRNINGLLHLPVSVRPVHDSVHRSALLDRRS